MLEKIKFETSLLVMGYNKILSKEDRKEGFLKRLKDIEDKNEEQLRAIRDQGERQSNMVIKERNCREKLCC